VSCEDRLLIFFGTQREFEKGELAELSLAPFIPLAEDGSGNRVCDDGALRT
jgi:hypothetical protein